MSQSHMGSPQRAQQYAIITATPTVPMTNPARVSNVFILKNTPSRAPKMSPHPACTRRSCGPETFSSYRTYSYRRALVVDLEPALFLLRIE